MLKTPAGFDARQPGSRRPATVADPPPAERARSVMWRSSALEECGRDGTS